MEEKTRMDPKAKAIAILFILLVVGAIVGIAISQIGLNSIDDDTKGEIILKKAGSDYKGERARQAALNSPIGKELWADFSDMYTMVTTVICMNLALLLGLLIVYIDSFKKTKSTFLMGLVLFIGVLFAQALFSLPTLQFFIGQFIFDIGLFNVIPNLFETIALIILFYLSME